VLAYCTVRDPRTLRAVRGLLESSERIYVARPDVFDRIGRAFEVGVALHTGKATYGGMSQDEFILVGDPVNLAFRLEALTRELGAAVVVSGDFVRELPEPRPRCRNHGVH
jgi:adenylate cyclase